MEQDVKIPFSQINMSTQNLFTGYGTKKNKRVVSSDLNLTIRNGEFVALIGTNGCGKSTLMRTICGLQKVISGNIIIDNNDITHLSSKQLAKLFSLVLTEPIEASNLTVNDIIAIGRYPYVGMRGKLQQEDINIVEETMERCNIQGFGSRFFSELSDGEKQRVMLAKALVQDTPLILLDEPTSHLDISNRIDIMKMLHVLSKQTNKSIIMSTHELDLALQWADSIWLMDKRGNIQTGTPEDLILNNCFSDVFNSEQATFDIYSGIFKMNQKPLHSIYLEAEEPYYFWIYRALGRYGFNINSDTSSEYRVVVNNRMILLQTPDEEVKLSSIAALLGRLLNETYWAEVRKDWHYVTNKKH